MVVALEVEDLVVEAEGGVTVGAWEGVKVGVGGEAVGMVEGLGVVRLVDLGVEQVVGKVEGTEEGTEVGEVAD